MRNYLILTRVMLRNMLSSMNPFAGIYTDPKKKGRAVVRSILVILIMLASLGTVIYLEYLIYTGLGRIGMPALLPALAIMASTAFTLVLGLFQGLSELFQGKDAPFLAVLPLTSRQVFTARLTTLYVSELGLDAALCIPAFTLYAAGTGSALPTAVTALPVLLLLPLIPLSLVAVLSSLLMRVSAFSRHRESIVMFLSVILAVAYSVGVTMMNAGDTDPAKAILSLMTQEGALNRLSGFFPPVLWATRGFTGDIGMLLLYAAVSLALAAGVIALAGPGYLNQALSGTESTVVRKKSRGAFGWKGSGALTALHVLEWKEILRTPAWAYNSLIGVLMFPLMIGVGVVTGVSNAEVSGGLEGLRRLLATVDPGYTALVAAGVLMLGSMVNPAVSTAVSREGGRWPFALTLPVRPKTRFLAKMLVGLEINLVCSFMIALVAWFVVRMNVLWLLAALAVSILVGLASAALSLWVDVLHPRLTWASEMEAIKKNFNGVFGMLLWILLAALCAVPAVLLWSRGGGAALLAAAGTALTEAAVSLLILFRSGEKHAVMQC